MNTKDNKEDHQETDEIMNEETISQVGENPKKKGIPKIVILIFVLILVAIAVSMSMDSGEKNNDTDLSYTNDPYQVAPTRVPLPPRSTKNDKPNFEKKKQDSSSNNNIPVVMTKEQKMQAIQAQQLLDRRRRSPLVSAYKQTSKIQIKINPRDEVNKRREQIQNNLMSQNIQNPSNEFDYESPANISTRPVRSVQASYITDRSFKLLQGKMIPAVLETAIDTSLSGMLRAIVNEVVYSEDGKMLLIPKGTRLIGEYKSDNSTAQTRIFVIWSRIIRPDGIDIKLDSPGTDNMGRSGITGYVDRHYLERFGASVLLSLISGQSANNAEDDDEDAIAQSFNRNSEIVLERQMNIPNTIHVNQGEKLKVYVAKDLNFKQAIITANKITRLSRK